MKRRIRFLLIYLLKSLKPFSYMAIGILFAGLGLKGFLLPNGFLDGGVTGIALLVRHFYRIDIGILILLINLPFVVAAYFYIEKKFAIKTLASILGLVGFLWIIPYPLITSDKLLISLFGGFFIGLGIGLCIRGGSVLDGTEILAVVISKRTSITVGRVIGACNVVIFTCSAVLVNPETAMYAILTYLTASKTVDFIIQGIEEYTGITIISDKSERVRRMILRELGKGVTIYKGRRGLHDEEIDIIYSVATRLEVPRLLTEIRKIDKNAFIIQQSINDIKGGVIKRRPLHSHE